MDIFRNIADKARRLANRFATADDDQVLYEAIAEGLGYYARNAATAKVAGTGKPWVYASGCRGLSRCVVPLRGKGDGPARYTVRLHFAETACRKPGRQPKQMQRNAPDFKIGNH